MDWHSDSMPYIRELVPIESKNFVRNLNGTDNAELNQYSQNGSFTYFDRLSFQVQINKKQTSFTVTKLNTLHTGVFTYRQKNSD